MCFADGSKAKVNLSPAETTSDLLEKDEVKENLTSSASYLWMVDNHGNGKLSLGETGLDSVPADSKIRSCIVRVHVPSTCVICYK